MERITRFNPQRMAQKQPDTDFYRWFIGVMMSAVLAVSSVTLNIVFELKSVQAGHTIAIQYLKEKNGDQDKKDDSQDERISSIMDRLFVKPEEPKVKQYSR